ncbi:MAG: hypothetical protein ABGX22_27765 [Pirellulaceae bacterium]|nr:hypothetical protein [Planctomycetaceae bacterium]
MREFTDAELEAYLDEALSPNDMAEVEQALRDQSSLTERVARTIARRDAGVHSLGEVWRRHRVSCPTRDQLGSYLLKALDSDAQAYVDFHIETVGCRFCRANLEDLRQRQEDSSESVKRKRRYFESSAGYLKKE